MLKRDSDATRSSLHKTTFQKKFIPLHHYDWNSCEVVNELHHSLLVSNFNFLVYKGNTKFKTITRDLRSRFLRGIRKFLDSSTCLEFFVEVIEEEEGRWKDEEVITWHDCSSTSFTALIIVLKKQYMQYMCYHQTMKIRIQITIFLSR